MGQFRQVRELTLLFLVLLCGCSEDRKTVLGTLEWDRIALPAPAAEPILRIGVREGERVAAGRELLWLDEAQTRARRNAADAEVARRDALLMELREGPRTEELERARANLAGARASRLDAEARYRRLHELGASNYVAQDDIDRAKAAAENAEAQVEFAEAALLELERGTRSEEVAQAEASLAQAREDLQAEEVLLEKLSLQAPRAGVIDSIPFKVGDEAPVGAPLVIMLVGAAPYARVYLPQPLRPQVQVGDSALVHIDGMQGQYPGRVRMVRSEPSFTPYYALTGSDVARLSFVAEIQLDEKAAELPAGLPLQVEFPAVGPVHEPEESPVDVGVNNGAGEK